MIALIDAEGELDFAALHHLAREAGAEIRAASRAGPVAVIARADRSTALRVHGALLAGVPITLLHEKLGPAERRRSMQALSLARALEGPIAAGVPPLPPTSPSIDPEAPALIVMTSGSTGQPKGVVLSRRALFASARASAARLGWAANDRWLSVLPLAHVGGASVLIRCLLAERAVVLVDRFEPERFVREIDRTHATITSLVPAMLARLLEAGLAAPESLRAAIIGGAAAPKDLVKEARARGWPILLSYGLSEAGSQVSLQAPGDAGFDAGAPLDGLEVSIAGGHIRVRGPTLFSGYQPSGQGLDAEGWLETRDLGELDAHGRLHVLGRADDQIVTGGEKVHPAEVEAELRAAPGVEDAYVFGEVDPIYGQVVAALLVPGPGFDRALLTERLAHSLASFKRPRRWALFSALPINALGKVDREKARSEARSRLQIW